MSNAFNAYNHYLAPVYIELHVKLWGFKPRSGWLYQFGDEESFLAAVKEFRLIKAEREAGKV